MARKKQPWEKGYRKTASERWMEAVLKAKPKKKGEK